MLSFWFRVWLSCQWCDHCPCRMQPSTMIHASNVTFYTHSMLVRVDKHLFDFRDLSYTGGQFLFDFVHSLGKYPNKIHILPSRNSKDNLIALAVIRGGEAGVMLKPTIKGVLPFIYLWRLQRWFREKLMQRRALAVMMCAQARLGQDSPLAVLPVDLLASHIVAPLLCGRALQRTSFCF